MKKFLIFISITILFSSNLSALSCLDEGRKLFNSKDYVAAEHALEKCSKAERQNPNIQISLASVKLSLAKYDEANKYFNTALKIMTPQSPYYAYIYSSLGDIAMQKKQIKQAMSYYRDALKYEPENINALIGYGLTLEKMGQKELAIANYKKALEIDFANLPARENLIRLEPDCLNDKEKLQALKERNIIAPEAQIFTDEDIDTLKKILKAERGSGIAYLSLKFGNVLPSGAIFESNPNTFYARKMLTLSGYQLLIDKLSSDAKEFFLSKSISASDLFLLKDFNGNPIFDKKGLLTEEGLVSYNKSLKGQKAYLLPTEKIPADKAKTDARIKEYLAQGYEEVTRLEFQYVEQETLCSEETLVKRLRCRTFGEGNDKHYFVLSKEDTLPPYSVPYMFVLEYRELYGKRSQNTAPVYKDTFGEKQRVMSALCDKNGNMLGML